MPILEVKNIEKSFGDTHVLKNISFTLEEGEVLSIMKESDDSGDQFHVPRDSQEITSARIRWV